MMLVSSIQNVLQIICLDVLSGDAGGGDARVERVWWDGGGVGGLVGSHLGLHGDVVLAVVGDGRAVGRFQIRSIAEPKRKQKEKRNLVKRLRNKNQRVKQLNVSKGGLPY